MSSAATLALAASAGFLLFGLVTGVWKYRHILIVGELGGISVLVWGFLVSSVF